MVLYNASHNASCSEARNGDGRLTVVARDGLDEDLHGLFGLGAGAAHAGDAGGTAHSGGGCNELWCGVLVRMM